MTAADGLLAAAEETRGVASPERTGLSLSAIWHPPAGSGTAHPIHGGTWWGAKIGTSTCLVDPTWFPVDPNRKNDGFELLS